jgi:predicted hydrolase (HD superfamily)
MTIEEARQLMEEWTPSKSLRGHMESVSACMHAYAQKVAPDDADRWVVAGLLHDFDYEKHPSAEEHPYVGVKHLQGMDVDEEICTAILGHADYTNTPRVTPMAQTLFAVDELSGFIVACAKVRPTGVEGMAPKSVKKKLKDKSFAAAVSREDIRVGVEELGVDLTEHIQTCIDAIAEARKRIGV